MIGTLVIFFISFFIFFSQEVRAVEVRIGPGDPQVITIDFDRDVFSFPSNPSVFISLSDMAVDEKKNVYFDLRISYDLLYLYSVIERNYDVLYINGPQLSFWMNYNIIKIDSESDYLFHYKANVDECSVVDCIIGYDIGMVITYLQSDGYTSNQDNWNTFGYIHFQGQSSPTPVPIGGAGGILATALALLCLLRRRPIYA